jgi:hypothetical protein
MEDDRPFSDLRDDLGDRDFLLRAAQYFREPTTWITEDLMDDRLVVAFACGLAKRVTQRLESMRPGWTGGPGSSLIEDLNARMGLDRACHNAIDVLGPLVGRSWKTARRVLAEGENAASALEKVADRLAPPEVPGERFITTVREGRTQHECLACHERVATRRLAGHVKECAGWVG